MQLYEATKTRSARCRWLLQELKVPFEGIKLQLFKGEHKTPAFLKINPYGRVPVLVDDDLVLSESIAICLYLADKYADKELIPTPGTPERGKHDQWLLFCATELEQPLWQIRRHTQLYTTEKRLPAEVEIAKENFHKAATILEDALRDKIYIVEDKFSVADIVVTYTLIWADAYNLLSHFPVLKNYMNEHKKRKHCPDELR